MWIIHYTQNGEINQQEACASKERAVARAKELVQQAFVSISKISGPDQEVITGKALDALLLHG